MIRLRDVNPLAAYIIALVTIAAPHARGDSLRAVILSDQPPPGIEPGVHFFFLNQPALNDAGQTAFNASLIGPDGVIGRDFGMWSEGTGTLKLVARVNTPAPDTEPGVNFRFLANPLLNSLGQVAFRGALSGPDITPANDSGIWIGKAGSLSLLVRNGDPAPGIGPGVTFTALNDPFLNDNDKVVFGASFTGPGTTGDDNSGIWSNRSGSLALVARRGTSAPGTPAGVNFKGFSEARFNESGQTAFFALLAGPGITTSNDGGYWSEGSGKLRLIAREGDPAPTPEPGVNFNLELFSYPALNNAGQTAFNSWLVGAGVTDENNWAVWSEGKGSLALVAREGSAAPGTGAGVAFSNFFSAPVINGAGQTAFVATLKGDGVTTSNRLGIWSEADGDLTLVARTGDAAPGTEPGVTFSDLDGSTHTAPVLNAAGQIAFSAKLAGPGITASNDAGIWAQDITGAVTLIAREGDLIEVKPGDFRTISSAFFLGESGLEDGRRAGFNERGQLAYFAAFNDGTHGVFVSDRVAVPQLSETYIWIGGAGLWSDSSKWNPVGTPAGNWIAKLQSNGDSVVVDSNSAVRQIILGTAEGSAALWLNAGLLRATNTVEVNHGGALHFNGGRLVTPAVEINGGDVSIAGANAGFSPLHLNNGKVLINAAGNGFAAPIRLNGGQLLLESEVTSLSLKSALTYGGSAIIEMGGTAELTGSQTWQAGSNLIVRSLRPGGTLRFELDASTSVSVASGSFLHNIDATLELAGSRSPLSDGTNVVDVRNDMLLLVSEGAHELGDLTGSGATSVYSRALLVVNQVRQESLSLLGDSMLTQKSTGGNGGVSVLNTLSIAGTPAAPTAKLDLTNSALVLDYPPAGPNPAADTRQQIIAGRGGTGLGKPWNGLGITSSTAQADVAASPNSRSIGYAVNADLPLGALTTFRGQTVDPSSVLIRYTRTADANLDGVVNDDDVTVVGTFYAPGVPKPEWAKGDFDYNGFVDDDDVTLLGVFYNPSATPIPASIPEAGSEVAAVPEPATITLLWSTLLLLFALRLRGRKERIP